MEKPEQSNEQTVETSTARYVLDTIHKQGVDHIFMVPGGVVDPFLDEFGTTDKDVKAIVAANEAGAAYMADGYARASGKFGVCMGIGGPGIANMVGPLAAAYADGSPILTLAGEVPTEWDGRGGFQDASAAGLNDIGFLSQVTELALEIPQSQMVPHMLDTAMRKMLGRDQRPVSLSFPKQIQTESIQYTPSLHKCIQCENISPRAIDLSAASKLIKGMVTSCLSNQTNITILAGSGAVRSEASDALLAFAEKYHIPVATTLKAKGVFPEDHPLSLGVFGYAGTQHSTLALLNSDKSNPNCPNQGIADNHVLIVLGSSLNQRDTMRWDEHLKPENGIYQADVNISAFSKNYPIDYAINSDIKTLLEWLLADEQSEELKPVSETVSARQAWLGTIKDRSRFYDSENTLSNAIPMHPARVIHELQQLMPKETMIIGDSGAHRAFAGHYWQSQAPREYR
ncbi:thiamine pyrophosphate-binding protein, partial [Photobacterium sanctipauli]|uniref:thiamine pyrophosphate-binding protein n=1 Tax=Photobacterium sanctipauli TaxID=1342794 RepID=UPI00068B5F40